MQRILLVALSATLLALTACEGKKEEPKKPDSPAVSTTPPPATPPATTPPPATPPPANPPPATPPATTPPPATPPPATPPATTPPPETTPPAATPPSSPAPATGPLTDDEKAVVGEWMVDPEGFKAAMLAQAKAAGETVAPEQLLQLEEMAKSMTMDMEFKEDRTCIMIAKFGPMEKKAKAIWSFADGKYKVNTVEEDGQPVTKEDIAYGTLKDGKLTIQGDEGPAMPLIRKPA